MKNFWQKRTLTGILSLAVMLSASSSLSLSALAESNEIVILYTNDVHAGVEDNIGYAGLALYEKQVRQETPYVTLVDAGDAIQGAPIGTISEGEYLIEIMDQVGYDVAIPGNHEFDYGMERFLTLAQELDCGYFSCNFIDLRTGKPVFKPYKIEQYGNTKVAFVGISTPESFTKSTPAYFQDANGNYIYGFCEDESGQKLYQQVQRAVNAARKNGADYVILVGHLGQNGVAEQWSSKNVIASTNGIDAFIDGHSHEVYSDTVVKNKDGNEVIVTQTGTKLKNIGKLTIEADGDISTELISKVQPTNTSRIYQVKQGDTLERIAKRELGSYQRWNEIYQLNTTVIPGSGLLTSGVQLKLPSDVRIVGEDKDRKAVDAQTDDMIKKIQAQFEESMKTVLGHSDYTLAMNRPDTEERLVRKQETNLGDFAADAYRYVLGADIGLANGGGLRSDVKAGDITYGDLLTLFPYGNMACMVETTGQQIKDALEMGVMKYPEESGGFQHVSGLTFDVRASVPSSVQLDGQGNFIKVSGAYRVSNIMVGDKPLELSKVYTVASHSYLLKSGGDGMNMFQNCKVLKDEVMVDVDMLSAYMQDSLNGNIGETYANYNGNGRINITNT